MIRIFTLDKGIKEVTDFGKGPHWIDCVRPTKAEIERLQKQFNLHPLTSEDIFARNVRVKIEEFPEHTFCVFYSLRNDGNMLETDFVLGKDYLITSHLEPLTIAEQLIAEPLRLEALMKKGLDFLMHAIIDAEVDHCFEVLEHTADATEKLEKKVAQNPEKALLSEIYRLKRQLGKSKRVFLAQREKMGRLAKTPPPFFSHAIIPYFRDVYDHSIQLSDTLDGYREEVTNAFEVYMSSVSNNMNEVMKVLSVIATMTLPLTVISGIYGTNFANLPGMYVHYGFWIMLAGMVLLVLSMLFYFRKKHWL